MDLNTLFPTRQLGKKIILRELRKFFYTSMYVFSVTLLAVIQ